MGRLKNVYAGWLILMALVGNQYGCTIQKRLFQRGYHLEWKHRHRSEASETIAHPESEQMESEDSLCTVVPPAASSSTAETSEALEPAFTGEPSNDTVDSGRENEQPVSGQETAVSKKKQVRKP